MAQLNKIKRPVRHLASWFVMIALLAQVLFPYAQALASDASGDIEYQLICTANGFKQIPVDGSDTPAPQDSNSRCPFCSLSSAQALLQPAIFTSVIHIYGVNDTPYARPNHFRQALVWYDLLSPTRAPPLNV